MSKLPAFQFYPADWRKDPGVQSLSFHDRGVWFEILCLMHESEQRGKLLLGGQPMPDAALARLLGLDKQNLTNTLTTLIEFGVASRDPQSGALVSRRMLRDEELRQVRAKCGKLGGNPNLVKQTSTKAPTNHLSKLDKQKETPSSSSSISISNMCINARDITCSFFGISEMKNFKAFREITEALMMLDEQKKLSYYIQQLEQYKLFKRTSGQQKCNYSTWLFGEITEERHLDNGHWCKQDYQLLNKQNNGAIKKSYVPSGATPSIRSGNVKDFGEVQL